MAHIICVDLFVIHIIIGILVMREKKIKEYIHKRKIYVLQFLKFPNDFQNLKTILCYIYITAENKMY